MRRALLMFAEGSENFSTASLDYNRELGIRTANAEVVSDEAWCANVRPRC